MKQYPDRLTIRRAVRLTQTEDDRLQAIRRARGGNPISNLLREAIVEFINRTDPQTTNDARSSRSEATKGD